MHEAPTPASTPTRDARVRAVRTLVQALAVTALVGAATAITELATDGGLLTLATVGTTAGTGALMAVTAYIHRRLEGGQS